MTEIKKFLSKHFTFTRLKRHRTIVQTVRAMRYNQIMTLKSEALCQLRYSIQKQAVLREAYYEVMVKKGREMAFKSLRHWNCSVIQKQIFRKTLNEKISYFQKKTFIKTLLQQTTERKYHIMRLNAFDDWKVKCTLSNVLRSWNGYIHSDDYLAKKLAFTHRRGHLLQISLYAFKRSL